MTGPSAVAGEHPRFQESPESSALTSLNFASLRVPPHIFFFSLLMSLKTEFIMNVSFGHSQGLNIFGLLCLVFKLCNFYLAG